MPTYATSFINNILTKYEQELADNPAGFSITLKIPGKGLYDQQTISTDVLESLKALKDTKISRGLALALFEATEYMGCHKWDKASLTECPYGIVTLLDYLKLDETDQLADLLQYVEKLADVHPNIKEAYEHKINLDTVTKFFLPKIEIQRKNEKKMSHEEVESEIFMVLSKTAQTTAQTVQDYLQDPRDRELRRKEMEAIKSKITAKASQESYFDQKAVLKSLSNACVDRLDKCIESKKAYQKLLNIDAYLDLGHDKWKEIVSNDHANSTALSSPHMLTKPKQECNQNFIIINQHHFEKLCKGEYTSDQTRQIKKLFLQFIEMQLENTDKMLVEMMIKISQENAAEIDDSAIDTCIACVVSYTNTASKLEFVIKLADHACSTVMFKRVAAEINWLDVLSANYSQYFHVSHLIKMMCLLRDDCNQLAFDKMKDDVASYINNSCNLDLVIALASPVDQSGNPIVDPINETVV